MERSTIPGLLPPATLPIGSLPPAFMGEVERFGSDSTAGSVATQGSSAGAPVAGKGFTGLDFAG